MLKTMKSGVTWSYPLDMKSNIKCEGYRGSYTIIDAAIYQNEVYIFLEHNTYGDEVPCLLAVLPVGCLRWYTVEKFNSKRKHEKYFFIRERDIIAESYDTISLALSDCYPIAELEEIDIWSDEEIDNMEVI